ncbi:PAS domain-containing protein [Kiloniella antarctica]|uniref:PAS domain-containing protein n=1 Tax=Kiloniella antarctica TaxID=1550907 RepID=A0ABW5BND2_9PROT
MVRVLDACNPLGVDSAHLIELLRYWKSLFPVSGLPGRQNIEPLSIPHILPYCELIDVHNDPLDFEYRLIGTKIDAITRGKYTGLRVSEIPSQVAPSMIFDLYRKVVEQKEPVRTVLPYIGDEPGIVEVESLVLPLAGNGKDVDMLLGGIALN